MAVIKKVKKQKENILNHGAKITCLCLLLGQMLGLDYLIIEKDTQASLMNRYKWVIIDSIVFLIWTLTLLWSFIFDRRIRVIPPVHTKSEDDRGQPMEDNIESKATNAGMHDIPEEQKEQTDVNGQKSKNGVETLKGDTEMRERNEIQKENTGIDGQNGKLKQIAGLFRKPLTLIPIIWLIYSLVLVAKIVRMFSTFALSLPQGEHLISSTFLKISLAKTAFILTLLIYAVKSQMNDPDKETLVTDKMGNAATLDVIDSIMLLDMLFSIENPSLVAAPIYHGIRVFACSCLVLPVVPLLSMVLLAESESTKTYHLNLIVNTALRMIFGNIPHLVLRLHLWHSHTVDVSTFLIKNLIVLFVGVVDIVKHVRQYRKDDKSIKKDQTEDMQLQTVLNT